MTESITERWLLARITPPVFGMLSSPVTHGRNTVLRIGPATRFFMNQWNIDPCFRGRKATLSSRLRTVNAREVGCTDNAGIVHELGDDEIGLRVVSARRQVLAIRIPNGIEQ